MATGTGTTEDWDMDIMADTATDMVVMVCLIQKIAYTDTYKNGLSQS